MTQATAIARLLELEPGGVQTLDATPQQDATVHRWSQPEIDALTLALAARRPLLVRGEPGTGKTQLSRAAAQQLGWALHAATVTPGMEPQDLVYRFDAIKRLADANAAARKDTKVGRFSRSPLIEPDYWEPGPLWKAFGWTTALDYGSMQKSAAPAPAGHVVLIDEIDKAESDLPNSLLEVLGQRSFAIPALGLQFGAVAGSMPLVMITTNEERELPAAFVRRCIVLNLAPDPALPYADWLLQLGQAHFGAWLSPADRLDEAAVLQPAARRLAIDRQAAQEAGFPPPGLAEYLDLLYALQELTRSLHGDARQAAQQRWMRQLSAYAFLKHPATPGVAALPQNRPFDEPGA